MRQECTNIAGTILMMCCFHGHLLSGTQLHLNEWLTRYLVRRSPRRYRNSVMLSPDTSCIRIRMVALRGSFLCLTLLNIDCETPNTRPSSKSVFTLSFPRNVSRRKLGL